MEKFEEGKSCCGIFALCEPVKCVIDEYEVEFVNDSMTSSNQDVIMNDKQLFKSGDFLSNKNNYFIKQKNNFFESYSSKNMLQEETGDEKKKKNKSNSSTLSPFSFDQLFGGINFKHTSYAQNYSISNNNNTSNSDIEYSLQSSPTNSFRYISVSSSSLLFPSKSKMSSFQLNKNVQSQSSNLFISSSSPCNNSSDHSVCAAADYLSSKRFQINYVSLNKQLSNSKMYKSNNNIYNNSYNLCDTNRSGKSPFHSNRNQKAEKNYFSTRVIPIMTENDGFHITSSLPSSSYEQDSAIINKNEQIAKKGSFKYKKCESTASTEASFKTNNINDGSTISYRCCSINNANDSNQNHINSLNSNNTLKCENLNTENCLNVNIRDILSSRTSHNYISPYVNCSPAHNFCSFSLSSPHFASSSNHSYSFFGGYKRPLNVPRINLSKLNSKACNAKEERNPCYTKYYNQYFNVDSSKESYYHEKNNFYLVSSSNIMNTSRSSFSSNIANTSRSICGSNVVNTSRCNSIVSSGKNLRTNRSCNVNNINLSAISSRIFPYI